MSWSRRLGYLVPAVFVAAAAANCSGGGGTPDAGDAAPDVVKPPPKDSGGDAMCGAVSCEICDVSGYSPTNQNPPAAHPGACTADEIASFVAACGANGSQTTCDNWQNNVSNPDAGADGGDAGDGGSTGTSAACIACAFSDQAAAQWGVYVCGANTCFLNTPGCLDVALLQTSLEKAANGTGSCGDLVSDSYGCQDFACGSCTGNDYDTCTSDAVANQCKSYDNKVQSSTGPCAALNGDAGVPDGGTDPNVCFGATDQDLATIAALLCGGP